MSLRYVVHIKVGFSIRPSRQVKADARRVLFAQHFEGSSGDGRRRRLQLRLFSRLGRVVEYVVERFFECFDVSYAQYDLFDGGGEIICVGVPMNLSKNVHGERLRDVHRSHDSVRNLRECDAQNRLGDDTAFESTTHAAFVQYDAREHLSLAQDSTVKIGLPESRQPRRAVTIEEMKKVRHKIERRHARNVSPQLTKNDGFHLLQRPDVERDVVSHL